MFENIIGQDKAISILRAELEAGALPGSVLIHGEPYSGKLSVALEIARTLACAHGAPWDCGCASCAKHRLLAHPGTLLLGSRSSLPEIAAASDVLRRTDAPSARYLYVRAIRKLTRRLDPELWEGNETRMRPAHTAVAELEDILAEIEPGRALPTGATLEGLLERAASRAAQVSAALPRDNTPIHMLRRTAFWAHLSSTEGARCVIVENADRMGDASRNSLLKLLEEPPRGVHLILLSTNHRAMIATVLSRVRRYALAARTPEAAQAVLTRVFRVETGQYATLSDYFRVWEGLPGEGVTELARQFLEAVHAPALDERPLLAAYAACQRGGSLDPGAFHQVFCRALVAELRRRWKAGQEPDTAGLHRCHRAVQTLAADQSLLNLQPQLMVQDTLYRLRAS